jgi:hypothetical protein
VRLGGVAGRDPSLLDPLAMLQGVHCHCQAEGYGVLQPAVSHVLSCSSCLSAAALELAAVASCSLSVTVMTVPPAAGCCRRQGHSCTRCTVLVLMLHVLSCMASGMTAVRQPA